MLDMAHLQIEIPTVRVQSQGLPLRSLECDIWSRLRTLDPVPQAPQLSSLSLRPQENFEVHTLLIIVDITSAAV